MNPMTRQVIGLTVAAGLLLVGSVSSAGKKTDQKEYLTAALRADRSGFRGDQRKASPVGPERRISYLKVTGKKASGGEKFDATFSVITLGSKIVEVRPIQQSGATRVPVATGYPMTPLDVTTSKALGRVPRKVVRSVAGHASELFGAEKVEVSLAGPGKSSREVTVSRKVDGQEESNTYWVSKHGGKVIEVKRTGGTTPRDRD